MDLSQLGLPDSELVVDPGHAHRLLPRGLPQLVTLARSSEWSTTLAAHLLLHHFVRLENQRLSVRENHLRVRVNVKGTDLIALGHGRQTESLRGS